jgi:hypothetical protein
LLAVDRNHNAAKGAEKQVTCANPMSACLEEMAHKLAMHNIAEILNLGFLGPWTRDIVDMQGPYDEVVAVFVHPPMAFP